MIGNVRKKGVRESLGYGSLVAPSVLNGLLYVSVPGNRISDFIEKYGVVASGNPRNRLLRELLLIGTRLVRERSVHHTSTCLLKAA